MRAATTWPRLTAVILAGGRATRLGGRDKPMLAVAGVPMLDRVLAALAGADLRIVVGPPRSGLPAGVLTTREEPPGAGPAAALAAALNLIPPSPPSVRPQPSPLSGPPAPSELVTPSAPPAPSAPHAPSATPAPTAPFLRSSPSPPSAPVAPHSPPAPGVSQAPSVPVAPHSPPAPGMSHAPAASRSALVGLFAADLPHLTAEAVSVLVDAVVGGVDGAVFVDERGKRQLLCGVWRADALRAGVGRLGEAAGKSMRAVFEGLVVAEVGWERGGAAPYFDCDTDDDLRQAGRQRADRPATNERRGA